jgi:predicted nucleic acid-binding protein
MTYLLDVSTLLAWLWRNHEHHARVIMWQPNQPVAICPITELGFIRISTQPIFGASIKDAREMLSVWEQKAKPVRVPCDLSALEGIAPSTGARNTDFYLANLAQKHGMRFATLDKSVKHPATFIIPN